MLLMQNSMQQKEVAEFDAYIESLNAEFDAFFADVAAFLAEVEA